jgi:cobalt/nickel transport system permease protein
MHIPDGFLTTDVALACAVPAAACVAVGLRRSNAELDERRVPLLGVTAAFIFAAQMLNFPVAGGTSGHFLGAALAAILLGPWFACLVMAVVIGVQAFVFADGGITALGANILNMGVIGALLVGGLMYAARGVAGSSRGALLAIAAGGSWLAVMAGATATSLELALSGTVPLGTVLPAMLGVHALIGIGEAVVTVAAVSAVLATRPDLVPEVNRGSVRRPILVLGLAVAIGIATAASPFASSRPDGLERVASDQAFIENGRSTHDTPVSGYAVSGISSERLATGLAGFAGTLAVFGLAFGVASVARRRPVHA